MTGFARGRGRDEALSWTWEAKSVNARGLDVRFRLPAGMDALEAPARAMVGERLKRGNVTLTLQLDRPVRRTRLRINRDALADLDEAVRELSAGLDVAPPRADGLLAIRGVVELTEEEETPEDLERRDAAILASLGETLDALAAARREEGARLAAVLDAHLDEIAGLADAAAACAAAQPDFLRHRLKEQLADILDAAPALPEDRLAQEVALLLTKSDVREEIDRLRAHVAAARELIADGEAAGRRLDFLCQEFNREGNTLCAKAADVELTRVGLDLKAAVDRFREQVQNVE